MNDTLFGDNWSFIQQKRSQSGNAETDVYLHRWSTYGNIDR